MSAGAILARRLHVAFDLLRVLAGGFITLCWMADLVLVP